MGHAIPFFKMPLAKPPNFMDVATCYIQGYAIKTQPWASENKAFLNSDFFLLQLGNESKVSRLTSLDPLKSLSLK